MKRTITATALTVLLAGCNTSALVPVDVSDLNSVSPAEGSPTSYALLGVEIASCTDRNDPELDSNMLMKAKSKIGHYVKSSRFVDCTRNGFTSTARFSVPVYVGYVDVVRETQPVDADGIHVYTIDQGTSEVFMMLGHNIKKAAARQLLAPVVNVVWTSTEGSVNIDLGDIIYQGKPITDAAMEDVGVEPTQTTLNNVRAFEMKSTGRTVIGYIAK